MFLRFTILSVKKMWWLVPIIILPKFLFEEMTWDLEWMIFVVIFIPLMVAFAFVLSSAAVFAIHGIRLRMSQSYKQQFDGKDEDATLRILERIYHLET